MKLQGFSIVFVLIILPLIFVLSYYIQLQVDTIRLQKAYDSKLLDSTYDAMSAFELNTANEDLSTVSDSLRTIIEASCNVFFNTLTTNLGMSNASRSYVEPYIPALLYTLYDGYYIYAPTSVPTVLTDNDGNAVAVGDKGVTTAGSGRYSYNPDAEDKVENYLTYDQVKNNGSAEDYGQLLYKTSTANRYTANLNNAEYKTKNVLKTYMPYSARYVQNNSGINMDITVVYTLDNYITIEGTIGNNYYTKSGYLIPTENVTFQAKTKEENGEDVNLEKYNQNDAQKYIEDGFPVSVVIDGNTIDTSVDYNPDDEQYPKSNDYYNNKIINSKDDIENAETYLRQIALGMADNATIENFLTSFNDEEDGYTITDPTNFSVGLNTVIEKENNEINLIQLELDKRSATIYYVKAYIFSKWIKDVENGILKTLRENSIVEISGQEYSSIQGNEIIEFVFSDANIFDVTNANSSDTARAVTEIPKDSPFYTHKSNIIRTSIQYNLNLAMTTYNQSWETLFDYKMPVMTADEWEKILTNVSIVSFMQGYSCGLKTYSNYMLVSSTNNEIAVSEENIYYVKADKFNDASTKYHRIDCEDLYAISNDNDYYTAVVSKDVKYDKIYDKTNTFLPYQYDHKNYACYKCINDTNYVKKEIFKLSDAKAKALQRAYYIGIGKARNNLYKMNAIAESEGYEIVYCTENTGSSTGRASVDLKKVKAIEFVFGTVYFTDLNEANVRFEVYKDPTRTEKLHKGDYTISQTANTTTVEVKILPYLDETLNFGISSSADLNTSMYFHNLAENSTVSPDGIVVTDLNTLLHNKATKAPKAETPAEPGDVYTDALKYIKVIYK